MKQPHKDKSVANNDSGGEEPNKSLEQPSKKEELFYEKFKTFLKESQEKKLIQKIVNFYGKNFEIAYDPKYHFKQRWEKKLGQDETSNELLEELHPIHEVLSFFTIIFNVYAIWALSVSRYFGVTSITSAFPLYQILLTLKISEALAKFLKKYWNQEGQSIKPKIFICSIHKELFCSGYFFYLLLLGSSSSSIQLIIELLITYFLWKQASLIYQKFKVSGWAIKYQNQIKICELLFNIFIQAHFFAILMFLSAKFDQTRSWTQFKNMTNSPLFSQYIYSYYFACTTILTIGYGDITPQDEAEVLVVILIQIVGVLSFGYLLNQMGHTLSKMRSKQEELQKDLQTVSKMAKYYNLQKKLQNKAKHFLLNNQIQTDSLKPNDQNGLFMKLNDDLRTQINNENSLSIIKSCIFFLCHWSKGFQTEIAKRLEKRLMSPTESLGQMGKNQRVFIIKQGTIEIFLNRFGSSNQSQKKLLKTISITPLSEVTDNIYGYTSAFSNRPVYLHAVAKDFTATYSISKEDFLQCVKLDSRDFQYYHEIKCRIDQAPFCQEWEVPAINNIREHFNPSKFFLIKKNKIKTDMNTNSRKFTFNRRQRKKYMLLHKMRVKCQKDDEALESQKTLQFQNITINFTAEQLSAIQEENQSKYEEENSHPSNLEIDYKEQSERDSNSDSDSESVAMEHARDWIKTYKTSLGLQENINKQKISSIFECQRNFVNFFPKNNFSTVLLRFQEENCMQKRITINESPTTEIKIQNIINK